MRADKEPFYQDDPALKAPALDAKPAGCSRFSTNKMATDLPLVRRISERICRDGRGTVINCAQATTFCIDLGQRGRSAFSRPRQVVRNDFHERNRPN